ncbi:pantoate--beta-alanine ligase [Pontibacter sp. BT310]|uniref:Pantothenate synthetase n=1 Tax=Pontibacter populi TaxID=890055 RepID=A0ABS6X8Y0_9BACT|nr:MULTISPECIES: pantoate--beta-alanine ligase [Pontibacter]MBJ6117564.1 pantoate--beta-alanine ligase [Pontibacter sp. BT310]MBR0569989.1 pantoate--beta-alanine ligase [Microvirga sp. STS03]MBW3364417.1 pantoate--beta-alanine ligase [Pontibacter populi]
MQVITQVNELRETMQALRCRGKSIGFVPTMGALHEGHLQLLRASANDNDITVCSIFVNPTQFNNPEDYNLYPRTLDADIALLQATGCDYIFAPTPEAIYPQQNMLQFSFGKLETVMEGEHRPGHFNGVATIVGKFFNIVQPHKAYFGQKDLQQVAIVRQLILGLGFNIELVCYPTVRETDGLAMSSRNKRLNADQRKIAVSLHVALELARKQLVQVPLPTIKEAVAAYLKDKPEVALEYFEIADPLTLQPLTTITDVQEVALCIAAHVGPVRLIDNLVVNLSEV